MTQTTIGDLVTRLAKGDLEAPWTFDDLFRDSLRGVAYRAGLQRHDREDVAQETVITAVLQVRDGRFRGECSLKTWVRSILARKIADHRRRQLVNGSLYRWERISPSPSYEPKQTLALCVKEIVRGLPREHRRVLLLNQRGGYTTREIARRIRRSPGRTGAILAEAKRMFREQYIVTLKPSAFASIQTTDRSL
jgi:RNA polymerase sigma factor (sigma-70 family)